MGLKVWSPVMELVCLKEEEETHCLWAKKEAVIRSPTSWHLDLELQPPELREITVVQTTQSEVFCYRSLNWLRHVCANLLVWREDKSVMCYWFLEVKPKARLGEGSEVFVSFAISWLYRFHLKSDCPGIFITLWVLEPELTCASRAPQSHGPWVRCLVWTST